ncbi:MAG: BON domain-containing protein [Burkholderiales bacterium]|nr:BON domain-containing protein [Burkholderiales bacterium]
MPRTASSLVHGFLIALFVAAGTVGCSSNGSHRSTGEYVDDATISTKVKSAFVSDKDVKASQIEVETYRGVVQLSGFVDSQAEASRAVQLAKAVDGVKDVKNDIRLKQ